MKEEEDISDKYVLFNPTSSKKEKQNENDSKEQIKGKYIGEEKEKGSNYLEFSENDNYSSFEESGKYIMASDEEEDDEDEENYIQGYLKDENDCEEDNKTTKEIEVKETDVEIDYDHIVLMEELGNGVKKKNN